jgi:Spy/CpxP family protein refolding chaperone
MKKLLLLLTVIAMVGTVAIAQEVKNPKKNKAEWEQKIKTELQLTDEQTVKFDAVNQEFEPKFDAIAQDASLSKEAQKEKKMALKKEKEAKLFEFFTPEQQAKYKEIMEMKKKEMSAKPAGS